MAGWQFIRLQIIYPLILLVLFFVDGNLMSSFGSFLLHPPVHIIPMLTLIWLFYGVQFEIADHLPFYFYVVGIGVLFDIYYTEILGTYTVAFLAATILMQKLRPYFDERIMSGLLLLLLGLLTYLLVTYVAGSIINIANLSLLPFIIKDVLPTAFLNLVIAALAYYPSWSLFQRLT
ncbi:cell shape determining protein MreD [Fructobacillus pseudoficulneus]|uniref:Cell shape determining protein MreD n=1 Tax=Fructobacillus pseudoficulneus TaxID=220714 RepID=A0A3F3GV96_9LACO|nr:rod shape-determining protein MreD [Fructobacillus pseudoficulneus]GAP02814.1 cell shape determining protein MreD [Fructobacillus pseudoficulneus]SEH40142.1 rod shape-determining protein MreD [Fructobacillus pseudoficulneus]